MSNLPTARDESLARTPDEVLPADSPTTPAVQVFVTKITTTWRKSVEGLIETAALIRQALDQGLDEQVRQQLADDGVMSVEVFTMFKKIAESDVLLDARYRPLLPASYNALYHLAQVPPRTLKAKLEQNEISASMTVEAARDLTREPTTNSSKPSPYVASFTMSASSLKDQAFVRSLARLAQRDDIELVVRVAAVKRHSRQVRQSVGKALMDLDAHHEVGMTLVATYKP